jgi:hypothetical protein
MKRSRRMVVPLLAAGVCACTDAPSPLPQAPLEASASVSPGVLTPEAGVAIAVEDAVTRVIPTLGDGPAAKDARAAFVRLGGTLSARDPGARAMAVRGARDAVDALGREGADRVEVAALHMVLDAAERLGER